MDIRLLGVLLTDVEDRLKRLREESDSYRDLGDCHARDTEIAALEEISGIFEEVADCIQGVAECSLEVAKCSKRLSKLVLVTDKIYKLLEKANIEGTPMKAYLTVRGAFGRG
jgi:hypothetical protein